MNSQIKDQRIAIVGFGLLGEAIAKRLAGGGYAVYVSEIDDDRRGVAGREGHHAWNVAGAAQELVDAIIIAVYSSAQADEAVDQIVRAWSRPEQIPPILCTTTLHPDYVQDIASGVSAANGLFFEFPISGTSKSVLDGHGLGLIGGNRSSLGVVMDVVRTITPNWRYVGESGSAAKVKLAINLILELNRSALAEGLAFAESLGLNPAQFVDILKASAANSNVIAVKAHKMINREFSAEGRCSQSLKDVDDMVAIASRNGLTLPLLAAQQQLLISAVEAGQGACDSSIVFSNLRNQLVQTDDAESSLGALV